MTVLVFSVFSLKKIYFIFLELSLNRFSVFIGFNLNFTGGDYLKSKSVRSKNQKRQPCNLSCTMIECHWCYICLFFFIIFLTHSHTHSHTLVPSERRRHVTARQWRWQWRHSTQAARHRHSASVYSHHWWGRLAEGRSLHWPLVMRPEYERDCIDCFFQVCLISSFCNLITIKVTNTFISLCRNRCSISWFRLVSFPAFHLFLSLLFPSCECCPPDKDKLLSVERWILAARSFWRNFEGE